jgi:hypothetical protein
MFVFLVTLFLMAPLADPLFAALLAEVFVAHGARRQAGGAILPIASGALA